MQVSRRKRSVNPLVSFGTSVVASEENATKRPSLLIETSSLPWSPCVKSLAMLDRSITPTAPAGTGLMVKFMVFEVPPPGAMLTTPI